MTENLYVGKVRKTWPQEALLADKAWAKFFDYAQDYKQPYGPAYQMPLPGFQQQQPYITPPQPVPPYMMPPPVAPPPVYPMPLTTPPGYYYQR